MDQLTTMAFGVSLFGGIFDLLTRRVPNWLTLPAILLALLAQFWLAGASGLLDGFWGVALGFGIFFPVYALGYMGAGDVKLLMAVGAFGGWRFCLYCAIASVVVGGSFAFFDILFRGRIVAVIRNTYSFLRALLIPELVPEPLRLDKERKFTFGICIAVGLCGHDLVKARGEDPLKRRNQKGQTMVEYVLIMFVVVTALVVILGQLKKSEFFYKRVTEPLVKHITYNYKYADPAAQGWDEGAPKRHIQISKPNDGQTFRLFQPKK